MSRSRSTRRLPALRGVLLLACAALLCAAATSAEPVTPEPLPPECEEKLAEFLKKAREAKRNIWTMQTQKWTDHAAEAAGIDALRVRALEQPAREAIERSLDEWGAAAATGWRQWVVQMSGDGAEMLDGLLGQVEESVRSDYFADYVRPMEQPEWLTALRRILTPEQMAAWERLEKERQEAALKEIAEVFKVSAERTREQLRAGLLKKSDGIKNALRLAGERAAEFDALAHAIASSAPEIWRKRSTRNLIWMPDEHRRDMLRNGFVIRPDDKESAQMDAAWEAGVAKLISAEETRRLQSAREQYRESRIVALAAIFIMQLDEQAAFTAEQRERLRPLAEREVRADPSLLPDGAVTGFYNVNLPKLLACGRTVKEAELSAILDETQRRRWLDACHGKSPMTRGNAGMFGAMRIFGAGQVRFVVPAAPAPQKSAAEPEDVESAVSDHLFERAETERRRLLAIHLVKAEDAARVAGLDARAASLLATAARGAAEQELDAWKTETDRTTRSQLQNATLENVKQRLAGMDRFFQGRRSPDAADQAAFWDATVKTVLTEAQKAAWQKELDARTAYRDAAIAGLVLAEFDRRMELNGEQSARLAPRLVATVRDYAPDISAMFSYSQGSAWYLQSYCMFLPVAAVPEAELKTILTKEQWDRWAASQEFGNASNYWENVQRIHAGRVKEKNP